MAEDQKIGESMGLSGQYPKLECKSTTLERVDPSEVAAALGATDHGPRIAKGPHHRPVGRDAIADPHTGKPVFLPADPPGETQPAGDLDEQADMLLARLSVCTQPVLDECEVCQAEARKCLKAVAEQAHASTLARAQEAEKVAAGLLDDLHETALAMEEAEIYGGGASDAIEEMGKLLAERGYCETCNGTGIMDAVVGYDEYRGELTEPAVCGECEGVAGKANADRLQIEASYDASEAELVTLKATLAQELASHAETVARAEGAEAERDEALAKWRSLATELWDFVRARNLKAPEKGTDNQRLIMAIGEALNKLEAAEAALKAEQGAHTQTKVKHEIACDTISGLQHERNERPERAVLSSLSSWLIQGMGDDRTTAADFEARIREGVETHTRVLGQMRDTERAAKEATEAKHAALEASMRELLITAAVCGMRVQFDHKGEWFVSGDGAHSGLTARRQAFVEREIVDKLLADPERPSPERRIQAATWREASKLADREAGHTGAGILKWFAKECDKRAAELEKADPERPQEPTTQEAKPAERRYRKPDPIHDHDFSEPDPPTKAEKGAPS